jgi:membrane protein YqaA with SNARE-associated domain
LLTWLAVTLGVAIGSALLPVISVEVFLVGLVTHRPEIPCWWLGAVIAVGQIAGKLPYFLAARGSLRLPKFLHRKERPVKERPLTPRRERWLAMTAWWRAALTRIRERCHRHPRWMFGTHAVSSVVGVPPFMATTVLAGLSQMRTPLFVTTGVLGRFLRFSLLAASPAMLLHHHWPH